jgi:hypothetical protein
LTTNYDQLIGCKAHARNQSKEVHMPEVTTSVQRLGRQIPQMTLMAVVIAVLMPAANYSLRLNDPTPAQLLVAICIGVFSSVVCLWILDSVALLKFRSEWVARSVWTAAIVSVLGTGVGVFQGAFAERKYPYEGPWLVRIYSPASKSFVAEHNAVMIYSQSNESYWGYSETSLPTPAQPERAISTEIVSFNAKKPRVTLRMLFADGKQTVLEKDLISEQKGIRFQSAESGADFTITVVRPR